MEAGVGPSEVKAGCENRAPDRIRCSRGIEVVIGLMALKRDDHGRKTGG